LTNRQSGVERYVAEGEPEHEGDLEGEESLLNDPPPSGRLGFARGIDGVARGKESRSDPAHSGKNAAINQMSHHPVYPIRCFPHIFDKKDRTLERRKPRGTEEAGEDGKVATDKSPRYGPRSSNFDRFPRMVISLAYRSFTIRLKEGRFQMISREMRDRGIRNK
jgi:hypothetical protein